MARVCFHCGKKTMHGRSHTHRRGVAGGRWKKRAPKTLRVFKANLQRSTIIENGKKRQVRLCAKCIKRIKKDIKDGKKPFLMLAYLNKIEKSQNDTVKKEKKTKGGLGKETKKIKPKDEKNTKKSADS